MSLPGGVVARGIRVVELEALDGIVASVHHTHAVGSARAVLGVVVKLVAEELDQLFDVDRLLMAVEVALSMDPGVINEVVCISYHAGDSGQHMVVNLGKFAGLASGHKEFGDFFFGSG